MDYKRLQFRRMVAEAELQLSCDCPLIEDEAIVWADRRMQQLESALLLLRGRLLIENTDAKIDDIDEILLLPNAIIAGRGDAL